MNFRDNPQGSVWHRWDPHLHAPGTLLSDQFKGDWAAYLERIRNSSPVVRALGVTDYFCIGTYRSVRERFERNELGDVEFLFPNVEIRLDIKTDKKNPINVHLLFSPDDKDHEQEIERILGRLKFEFRERTYSCTLSELAALGRAYLGDGKVDEFLARKTGANQFKVSLQDLKELFRTEKWVRRNCLVAVAGSSNDGTAGLQRDDSYSAMRREIETFAHIIFASTPSQIDFWLGKKVGFDRTFIEETYGGLKPCLHGSDAHRDATVAEPSLGRACWLKGNLTFETVRQAVIEPENRVWIGPTPPERLVASDAIASVSTAHAPWLTDDKIELNPGLVAIIGARGSGKTALAEIIAKGAYAARAGIGESSFLRRAFQPNNLLGSASVTLTWGDGAQTDARLAPGFDDDFDRPVDAAQYLSQHFVENLCSAAGLATELRKEMERVVFESTEQTQRLGTDSFDELLQLNLRPVVERRSELQRTIESISEEVVLEEDRKRHLPAQRAELISQTKQTDAARQSLVKLVPKDQKAHAEMLGRLETACAGAEAKVENLRRISRELDELAAEVAYIRKSREPNRFSEMRRKFAGTGLTDAEWAAFEMSFRPEADKVLKEAQQRADLAVRFAEEGDPAHPVDRTKISTVNKWPLKAITTERDRIRKRVGADAEQHKKLVNAQRTIAKQELTIKRLNALIKTAEGAETRRQELLESRRQVYAEVFETLVEEQAVLEEMYAPLEQNLGTSNGALTKLRFVVHRAVNIGKWVENADRLLDFRMDSEFRLRGSLRKRAEEYLLGAWKTGTPADVAAAMEAFRAKYGKDLLASMPPSLKAEARGAWIQAVAAWLYSTEHVTVEYGIQYEGVAIEQLSPGTRGIVLLLLYLAVDTKDVRPLIIDQPEENLDPNSVFQDLVPHFREARKRRQLIIVTHNANLVVNTDADQVIVAHSQRESAASLPYFWYERGSLENSDIRGSVCSILEGGERAFLERERRYRLRWAEELG